MTGEKSYLDFLVIDKSRVFHNLNQGKVKPDTGVESTVTSGRIDISGDRQRFIDTYCNAINALKVACRNDFVLDVRPEADERKEYAHYIVTYIPI